VFQAFDVEDKLRAHELNGNKPIVDVHQYAGWGVRSTSVVIQETGFENEIQDVGVVLAAEMAMLVDFGRPLERLYFRLAHKMHDQFLDVSKLYGSTYQ
jgi:hypothetical protein